jgi:hypothetical protein
VGDQQSLFAEPGDDAEDADDRRVIVVGGPRAYRDPSTGMIVDPDHHGPSLVFGGGYRTITQAEQDAPRLAHHGDPGSSLAAARDLETSGDLGAQRAAVLAALRAAGRPVTSAELAQASGLPRPMCARRLPDLDVAGPVARDVMRACRVTGRQCVTWRIR